MSLISVIRPSKSMKVTDVASHLAQMKYDNHVVELDSGSEDEQLDGIPPVTEELQVDSCCCCCC